MKIDVVPYDARWPEQYCRFEAELRKAIAPGEASIEHIGSTAVEGLSAKPIIDILIGTVDDKTLNQMAENLLPIRGIHYIPYWEDEMPFRRFFIWTVKDFSHPAMPQVIHNMKWNEIPHENRLAHIHATTKDHTFYKEHLKFRDILRSDEHLRNDYQQLKMKLAQQHWKSGADYAGAKGAFIRSVFDQRD